MDITKYTTALTASSLFFGAATLAQAQNLYTYAPFEEAIAQISPTGQVSPFVDTGPLASPGPMASDAAGNLLFVNGSQIFQISRTGSVSTYATLPDDITVSGIGFGANGILYFSGSEQYFSNEVGSYEPEAAIGEILPNGSVPVLHTYQPNYFSSFGGIAIASDGSIYTYETGNVQGGTLDHFSQSLGSYATVASGLNGDDLAIDPSGNVYVATREWYGGGSSILEVSDTGNVSTFALFPDASQSYSLAFGAAGNLFASDFTAGSIYEITPSGSLSTFAKVGEPVGLAYVPPVPEPSPAIVAGIGISGMALFWRRKGLGRRRKVDLR